MDKKKYPIGPEHYLIYEEVGQGVSAFVRRALCVPLNSVVAIKILDCERDNVDLNNISREAQTMNLIDHPNILKSLCSFVADHNLWVVMPYMAGGSCLHILKAAYPDGFEEVIIATVLREVLKGLDYLHQHGHIHRDVKAGNILIDANGAIKLGDFGVSACLFDSGDRQRMRNTFVGTPCWMAPEVMEQLRGYDCKADIWSFGITALELAHGHAPFSKYPPMKVLLMTLQNAPPGLDYERDKKFSKSFKQMIASCLVKDPSKRPSAKRLLKHSFFKQARSNDYIARKLLEGLPNLGDRMKALKKKEEDMLAQKKMADVEKEELSQSEYKRGISDWNFNLEDVKAQASLINDDDITFDKDQAGNTSFSRIDSCSKLFERQFSNMGHSSQVSDTEEDPTQCQASALPILDSSGNCTKGKGEKSDDDASIASSSHEHSTPQCCSPHKIEHFDNNMSDGADADNGSKAVENGTLDHHHHHRRSTSVAYNQTGEVLLPGEKPLKSSQSSEGGSSFQQTDSGPVTPKGSKTSPANSDVEDKARMPVVQQKGRFKVTSENVELEKVTSAPVLHKSHSMQVIGHHPTTTSPSSTSDASSGSALAAFAFPVLQSFLQTNINQRENILSLMKQISSGEIFANRTGEGTYTSASISAAEKSMLEAAHDREKELLQEITDLQLRLLSAQEEIQKLKTENGKYLDQ